MPPPLSPASRRFKHVAALFVSPSLVLNPPAVWLYLAGRVPELQAHDPIVEVHRLGEEVYADGGLRKREV